MDQEFTVSASGSMWNQPLYGMGVQFKVDPRVGQGAYVNVVLGSIDAHVTRQLLGERFEDAFWHIGMIVLERALRSGIAQSAEWTSGPTVELRLSDEDVALMQRISSEKECSYQQREGRDLFCYAASESDRFSSAAPDGRFRSPTSRPLCIACNMPDDRYLCSHLLHPGVETLPGRRQLLDALCDRDRPEIAEPGGCHAGGHGCWQKFVVIAGLEIEFVAPAALADAFDYLDAAWQLCFGNRLLNIRTAATVVELTSASRNLDEFKSRLSALDDLLKGFRIPDAQLPPGGSIPSDQTFKRMEAVLSSKLPPSDLAAIASSFDHLKAINRSRVALQHTDRASELPQALGVLGLAWPIIDYGAAWDTVRSRAVAALKRLAMAVRDGAQTQP